jgi:hypothetical protein
MERGVGFCVLPDAAFVTCFESGHLFPRHVARSVPAHRPDIHRGLASRAPTGPAYLRSPVGASAQATLPASPERRYALREIKVRLLAQASFRDAVLSAYVGRCAISHLPEPRLLDAAVEIRPSGEKVLSACAVTVIALPFVGAPQPRERFPIGGHTSVDRDDRHKGSPEPPQSGRVSDAGPARSIDPV